MWVAWCFSDWGSFPRVDRMKTMPAAKYSEELLGAEVVREVACEGPYDSGGGRLERSCCVENLTRDTLVSWGL